MDNPAMENRPASVPAEGAPVFSPPVKPVIAPVRFERVPWRRVLLFVVIAYALFTLIASPFWLLPEGIGHPLFTPVIMLGMWAPAIASIIMAKAVERTSWRTRVGLRWRGRWKGIILASILGPVVVLAVCGLAVLVMAARGVPVDLSGSYWMAELSRQLSAASGTTVPPAAVIGIVLVQLVIGLPITLIATLGEEIGWRGWLWPALRPLGRIRACITLGVIWSLWHLPVVLIGYNYAGESRLAAIGMFAVLCSALSLLFSAQTDRAGGNPVPAAITHAAWNSWGGLFLGMVAVPETMPSVNQFLDTHAGLTGVILLVIAGAAIMPWRSDGPVLSVPPTPLEPAPLPAEAVVQDADSPRHTSQ